MHRIRGRSRRHAATTASRAAALVGLVVVALAGCGGSGDSPDDTLASEPAGGGGPAVTTSASPAASPAGASPAATSATPAGGASGAASACVAGGLSATVDDLQGAAGHIYGRIVLTNTGSAPCVITGFPGVSVVDAAGAQIGAPAGRTGAAGSPVTVAPGGRAGATLAITQPGVLPGCDSAGQTTRGTQLRVYPPGDRASLLAPVPGGVEACRDPAIQQLTVSAFERV
ncbi:Protein of unknown function (DUF4232) [Frankia sp. EI5c]|uniref:DUF4232 domain-containing protein n=1 Tax=Frankia sp. EI5c TaxID=683316 RepID=UPI0007C2CE41|nr:DUF4232 domain-containing protein [Frankia sp. EI5c]OAA25230.1 Protein of unknown function (DUF4232) [Frankia sp. EI5c]